MRQSQNKKNRQLKIQKIQTLLILNNYLILQICLKLKKLQNLNYLIEHNKYNHNNNHNNNNNKNQLNLKKSKPINQFKIMFQGISPLPKNK